MRDYGPAGSTPGCDKSTRNHGNIIITVLILLGDYGRVLFVLKQRAMLYAHIFAIDTGFT